jgi:hypothetical protein
MKFTLPPVRTLASSLAVLHLIAVLSFTPANAAPPPSAFGVWDRGDTFDPKDHPFLKGFSFNQRWADVEGQPGVFDWSGLDRAVEKAHQRKMFLYLSLEAGPESPDWIYAHGVPRVTTKGEKEKHTEKWNGYPYYLAPAYKTLFQRLIAEWARHIRTYPREKQERIAFIQIKTGCTGDETPYKGTAVESRYDLPRSAPAWRDFRLETFALFVKHFQEDPSQTRIDLLFNAVGPVIGSDEDAIEAKEGFVKEWDWVTAHVRGSFGIKNGALSRGHHLVGERSLYKQWTPYLVDPKGLTLFRRSEMDQTWQKPWYQLNVPLNFYWGAVNALHGGQSIWDISKGAMEACKEQGFDYSFHFFSRYAGQIHPKTATDAFCALHKGLDAADAKAYPESVFGPAERRNVDRMLKITAAYSKYGAAVDDKNALLLDQVRQRDTQTGFNDVGWDIWPENYSRFLYQIDPDETSVPRWRVGGPLTKASSIYDRFARGFEHAAGKDALYFKLHDGFSADKQPKTMSIHVLWYDGQAGSTWKLLYDAGQATMRTALTVTGTGEKKWKSEIVTLKDAVFARGGVRGSDLALVNADEKDDLFSLIEIHRGDALPEWKSAANQPAVRPAAGAADQPTRASKREERRKAKGK